MNTLKCSLFILGWALLVACGGGGGEATTPVVDESPDGIWHGTFTDSFQSPVRCSLTDQSKISNGESSKFD